MDLPTTLLFYLLIGSAVAVAVHQTWQGAEPRNRLFCTCTALAFWPLYLPALLQYRGCPAERHFESKSAEKKAPPGDEMSSAIQQVEAELALALESLDGWSDNVLAREQDRFTELRNSWHSQAEKIRELDHLLQQPTFADVQTSDANDPAGATIAATPSSERGRRANIARLAEIRDRLQHDLMNTLGAVRELITMIHLAKYTGAPASRAEELVMQIATSIEGLSEVATWQREQDAGSTS